MDFFGGTDVFAKRNLQTNGVQVGLAATNPIAHLYAEPLFKAGVAYMCLAEMVNYVQASEPVRHHWIYIVMEGRLSVSLGRRRQFVLEPGMMCVVPEGTTWVRRGLTEKVRCIMFSLRLVPHWQPLQGRGARTRNYEFAESMHSLVRRVVRAYHSDSVSERYVGIALSGAIVELLNYELFRLEDLPSTRSDEVEALFRRIQANPAEDWPIERMTVETSMPVRTLTRHCRRVYGASPLELVIRQRLRLACELLSPPNVLSIDEVAARVGYSSGASLSTVFFRYMNMRPGEYRTRQKRGIGPGPVEPKPVDK